MPRVECINLDPIDVERELDFHRTGFLQALDEALMIFDEERFSIPAGRPNPRIGLEFVFVEAYRYGAAVMGCTEQLPRTDGNDDVRAVTGVFLYRQGCRHIAAIGGVEIV